MLFPVIYFLFVTAKCLSYRGSWSLSHKHHTNGHMYYYKQTGNKTCYVRRRDEPQVLAEYKERQKWRQERKKLNQQLGIPENLRAVGVTEDKIPAMAADAMKAANVLVNPRATTLQDIIDLYHKAY